MDINRMRACAPLLPEPGAEVVLQCLDEIERLRAALRVAQGALLQCSPCAHPECEAVQREWLDEAVAGCGRALGPNDEGEPHSAARKD